MAVILALYFLTMPELNAQTIQKASTQISDSIEQPINVKFTNVNDPKIKACFLEVYGRYKPLHKYDVKLVQKSVKASTMQAQPILSLKSLLTGVKRYQIKLAVYVKDSQKIKVADLPHNVLVGWFAHELGHVVDYEPRSNIGMMIYGLRYLISDKFKREVEHKADTIAVEHGFAADILATKRYILENDFLGEDYKAIIRKYYMSIAEVEVCIDEEHAPIEPKIEL